MQPKVSKMKSTPQIAGHNQPEDTNLITSVTTINRKIFQPDYLIIRQILKESGNQVDFRKYGRVTQAIGLFLIWL